jgi:hypothetical protein
MENQSKYWGGPWLQAFGECRGIDSTQGFGIVSMLKVHGSSPTSSLNCLMYGPPPTFGTTCSFDAMEVWQLCWDIVPRWFHKVKGLWFLHWGIVFLVIWVERSDLVFNRESCYIKNGQKTINNSLFICMCILRDLPKQKNPGPLCRGNFPSFMCSHVPMEIFFSMKWQKCEEIKRVVGSRTTAFS